MLDVAAVGLVFHDDLSAEVDKGFVDVCSSPRAGFEIRYVPFAGYGEGAGARYGAVFFEVGFVADEDHGDVVVFFYSPYLLAELGELVE